MLQLWICMFITAENEGGVTYQRGPCRGGISKAANPLKQIVA
jgi:hypothetical protein